MSCKHLNGRRYNKRWMHFFSTRYRRISFVSALSLVTDCDFEPLSMMKGKTAICLWKYMITKLQHAKYIRHIHFKMSVDNLNFLHRRFTCSLFSLFPFGFVAFFLSSSSFCIIFAWTNSFFVHITFQVILCSKNHSKD